MPFTAYFGRAVGKKGRASASTIREYAMAKTMAKNTICLWYDKDAEAAARFYAETFPDSAVAALACIGLNGGPAFKHSEAFSFQIATDDQEETDRYWNAIVNNGGQESA